MAAAADVGTGSSGTFARDVEQGLCGAGQKQIPSEYLYDALGTALFQAITHLPEYGLTRADSRLLRAHAREVARSMPVGTIVAELGSGDGKKTRHILEALSSRGGTLYYPIDISTAALAACREELSSAAHVVPIENNYLDGLHRVMQRRWTRQPMLVLFLGSSIGNFDPPTAAAFLGTVNGMLQPGDALLVGADLIKPASMLIPAYDDGIGVTAAFNKNVLARLNRELGGEFDLKTFAHEARYDSAETRVEMHLRSEKAQKVRIERLDTVVEFASGETIWTESSYKFDVQQLSAMAGAAGFAVEQEWVDQEWPFAEMLWRVPAR